MKFILTILLAIPMLLLSQKSISQTFGSQKLSSPDKRTEAKFAIDKHGNLQYTVKYNNKTVIAWSALGLELNNGTLGQKTRIMNATRESHIETFKWEFGEKEFVKNNYNELNLSCTSNHQNFNLLARVFNGSIAFKYIVPEQAEGNDFRIKKELTTFDLSHSYRIFQYHHETVFSPIRIDSLNTTCDFPATLTNGKFFISIGEAENLDYTKAELGKGIQKNSLNVVFARDKEVKFSGLFQTPWRTVSFSNTAIGLHQFSDLFLRLNPPPVKEIPSSIQPGKLIRSELNTQAGFDCIDLAEKLNFRYIMFDAGWYGPERAQSSDPRIPIPQIDMPKVIQYGKKKGIGVIVYVNYIGLQNHLDEILPLYKKWGIAGMKFGFIDGFSQKGLGWLSSAIRKVNDYGLVLNIHDNYKPTGLSRTYPALLSQEGIRGDENSPDAFHTTTLPYTRFLAGAADFTFCFPNPKNNFSKNLKVSKGQQLALTVVYFSPLQAIFWYGKPKDYTNSEEIEFFKYVPTVWDDTHYLKGEIGKNISVARRSGTTWFVGNVAGHEDWKEQIKLDFLKPRQKYIATVYEDNNSTLEKKVFEVKKGDVFKFIIKGKGGQAIILRERK
ncbi:glycoside hydrolase family 97 catalytic domain-containing protein [Pedobacter sp. P351]|uniref:glycoside hydrolase family 97 protein n=1 Tax=Pedobacter superstes TaxID=3133441 RepID=UPI00309686E7